MWLICRDNTVKVFWPLTGGRRHQVTSWGCTGFSHRTSYRLDWETQGREKLNLEDSMVCVEDPRKIVLEKMTKLEDSHRGSRHQWRPHERLQNNAQALCPTRLGRRTNPMIQKERTCRTTGASGMHTCKVSEWNKTDQKKMTAWLTRNDEVWEWSKSTDGETDTKRSQMKIMDETRP